MPSEESPLTSSVTALRFYKSRDLRVEEVAPLPCGPNDVRIKIAFCGICGSDLLEYQSGPIFPPAEGKIIAHTGVKLPVTLGHEFSGTVIELGSNVQNLSLGQAVAVNPACDHRHYDSPPCSPCNSGHYNLCDATATHGLSAPGGGFSQETVVNSINCLPLPDNISLRTAALIEPLAVAQHCVSESGFVKGQTVMICGAGPIGLALISILRVAGASKIIVTEILDQRRDKAQNLGADTAINPLQKGADGSPGSTESALASVRQVVNDGVDIAFDATGVQSTLDLAIASTKAHGTIFNVAIHKQALSLNVNSLTFKEKKLLTGICYLQRDFEAVIKMLADGSLDAEGLITSVIPLSRVIEDGFEELINNRDHHVKILVQPN